ncbi:c-type cytochrome domain-containing protein [Arenibacter echinorum]|uniref:Putative membrane protein n=1 Tax=Arenibacter echinorum TaxID=440515 RepID=A0A327RDP0_9FLAO|nr:c-type cytochrome domain-containing protein [Arenibacter echinorum]RAJ14032.1 putative membrane protein [Arenibacter echinorum]
MGLILLLNGGILDNPPDIVLFLGRFHPVVVHLPIGFLIMAILLQVAARWPKYKPLTIYIPLAWLMGAVSALIAVIFGYFLSLSGDYDEDILFWHQWAGIVLMLMSFGCYFINKKWNNSLSVPKWALVFLVGFLLMFTGHLGGNLTHGSTYLLQYAPNPVRYMAGLPSKVEPRKKVAVLDSADVFLDLVLPMMQSKCVGCHNEGKKKGGLLLTSYAMMMRGGESENTIVPGDALKSELVRRITLPMEHDDFMPSEGKLPLTDQEVVLIKWWIKIGAPSNGFVTQLDTEKALTSLVSNYLGLDKNNLFNKKVPPPDQAVVDSLINRGFVINPLMKDNYFIDANYSLSEYTLEASDMDILLKLKEQLVWLNLGNSKVKDAYLEKIGLLQNLVKLDLKGNEISDAGIKHLSKLENLESLNLYGTKISKGVLELVPQLTRLKKIYLWQTQVTSENIAELKKENPGLTVIYERE